MGERTAECSDLAVDAVDRLHAAGQRRALTGRSALRAGTANKPAPPMTAPAIIERQNTSPQCMVRLRARLPISGEHAGNRQTDKARDCTFPRKRMHVAGWTHRLMPGSTFKFPQKRGIRRQASSRSSVLVA